MKLPEKFRIELDRLDVPAGTKILVAISGGVDSIVLLNLCVGAGLAVEAAHVNYGLRGSESDSDEAFVKGACADLGIPCYVMHSAMDLQREGSIQEDARKIRYNWFSNIMSDEDIRFLMTAHHLDDRLETFFMNLLRGAGVKGLKSIPERNQRILRPLLRFRKSELIRYAAENEINWREDSSNQEDFYLRNRIRHELIPVFESFGELSVDKAGESLEFLAEADGYFRREAGKFMSRLITDGFICKIYDPDWDSLFDHPPLNKYVFEELGFSPSQLSQLDKIRHGSSGKQVIGKRFVAYRDRGCVVLKAKGAKHKSEVMLSDPLKGLIEKPLMLRWNRSWPPAKISHSSSEAWLDAHKLAFPLELRKWRQGDHFIPLGMSGKKKVSDFLVDEKVSLPEKESVYVLVSEGRICWVVGFRIADDFKLTPGTEEAVHFVAS